MRDWIAFLLAAQQRDETVVVITVAATKGSVPRAAGTKMVVTIDAVHGTIGGGHLEFTAIDIARNLIKADGQRALQRFPLGATLGQCCGGVVNLLFEPVAADAAWVEVLAALVAQHRDCIVVTPISGDARGGKLIVEVSADDCVMVAGTLGSSGRDDAARAMLKRSHVSALQTIDADANHPQQVYFFDRLRPADFHLVLFGAGHVGRALVKVMADIDCRVRWVDSRGDAFPLEVPANTELVCTDAPDAEVVSAAPGSYFLVMTHSHALDQTLCEQILRRADFAYCGLIGSLSKRRQFERRLTARGISAARLTELICPIGGTSRTGKEPASIAIAVAAELLRRRSEIQHSHTAAAEMIG